MLGAVDVQLEGLTEKDGWIYTWLRELKAADGQPKSVREAAEANRLIMPLPLVVQTTLAGHGSSRRADMQASFESVIANSVDYSNDRCKVRPMLGLTMNVPLLSTRHQWVPMKRVADVRFLPFGNFSFSPAMDFSRSFTDRGTPYAYYTRLHGFGSVQNRDLVDLNLETHPSVSRWLTNSGGHGNQKSNMLVLPPDGGSEERLVLLDVPVHQKNSEGLPTTVRQSITDQLVLGKKNGMDQKKMCEEFHRLTESGVDLKAMSTEDADRIFSTCAQPLHSIRELARGQAGIVEYLWKNCT